ncbi:hypothetical protein MOQ_005298 [Trypanosoma cruzi marinkellei]|uniref:Clu domain-containing protein n=1 Tax=Trypanosoma cruzi marinkellei TaxID=85056 RepID=K2MYJ4_TRYCR|nr:hypothetical protein MOQ_005298 [Trypanosoma cruzi marinkellei]
MDRAFVNASVEYSPLHGRDWNAEFQLAWEMDDSTISQAEARMEQLCRVEREFVAEATRTVKQIVMLDDDGPRELPKFLQCYRVDNIFFRVLPDSRSGRNYVASLRGVLQSRTRLLSVPLSCMFFYRGMPVLAQALVPMPREPTRLYGAGSTNNQEVVAEILHMAEALNIPLPNSILCEVYEGLDARWYCTSTNITTIYFAGSYLLRHTLKRQEMLVFSSLVTSGPEDVFSVMYAPPFLDALAKLKGVVQAEAQNKLCDILHFYGINFCFLKEVLQAFSLRRGTDTEAVKALENCVIVEMFARAIKQELYLRIQANRTAYDGITLQNDVARYISCGLDAGHFKQEFLPVLARKYKIGASDKSIIASFDNVRQVKRHDIIARLVVLIGARLLAEETSLGEKFTWLPEVHARVLPSIVNPNFLQVLALQYNVTKTTNKHLYAFCLPLQSKLARWEGDLKTALQYALEVATAEKARHGEEGLPYLYALREVCELLFSEDKIEWISDGCKYMETLLGGFDKQSGALTRMRRHIECACWFLGKSGIVDLRKKALHQFCIASRLAPTEIRSECGAWLYIRPFLGILRCKQMMRPERLVDISEIARDAEQLARIVAPADYFVEYLWELGMEMQYDEKYEMASELLQVAFNMLRKVPYSALDSRILMHDLIKVCRACDPARYGKYCDELLNSLSESQRKETIRPGNSSRPSSMQN